MKDGTRRLLARWVVGDRSVRRLIVGVIFVYGSLALFAWLAGDRLLYQPHPTSYEDGASTSKLVSTGGAKITARFEEAEHARAVVLYSHGNAEDLGDVRPLVEHLVRAGLDVLAYDYQGYGTSEGTPSEAHLQDDISAAYRELTETRHVDPARVLVYGRSLGSGPSVWLASHERVGGLILESAFTSPYRVVTRVRLLPWDPFPSLERMTAVRCPVLVVHAIHDRLIPFSQGEALFAAANAPKRHAWMPTAGHADIPFEDEGAYDAAIKDFVASLGL